MKNIINVFRKIPKRTLMLVLIVAVAVSMVTVAGTFAAFRTTVIGVGETPVSQWKFDVKINDTLADTDSMVYDVDLVGVRAEDFTYANQKYDTYNLDANDLYGDGQFAPGASGYMPVEIKGNESKVSILATVKAYFINLPTGMRITDNLGRELKITRNVTGFTPNAKATNVVTDWEGGESVLGAGEPNVYAGGSVSSIEYKYYFSYSEVAQWAKDNAGVDYIDIGFRWTWVDDDEDYGDKRVYSEIQVTGVQVTNVNTIPESALTINFADSIDATTTGVVLDKENVLNILTKDVEVGDEEILPTASNFYLDLNGHNVTASSQVTFDVKPGTAVETVVLGTSRRAAAHEAITDKSSVKIAYTTGTTDVDAYISGDLAYVTNDYFEADPADQKVKASNVYAADLVSYINKALSAKAYSTMYDALTIASKDANVKAKFGASITVDQLAKLIAYASEDGDEVLWDSVNKFFVYTRNGKEVLVGNQYMASDLTKKVNFFKVYTAMPATQTYSIYALDAWTEATVADLSVGFDAGANDENITINYDRSGATVAQSAIIRTNTFATRVEINAPLDTVTHYGYAGTVNIIAVAAHSYEENGIVGRIDLDIGHVNINSNAIVYQVTESAGDTSFVTKDEEAILYAQNGTKIDGEIDSRDTGATNDMFVEADDFVETCAHTKTNYVIDGKLIYEVCEHCGYTVITVVENDISSKHSVQVLKEGSASEYENVITPIMTFDSSSIDTSATSANGQIVLVDDAEPLIPTPDVDENTVVDNTCEHEFGEMQTINAATTTANGLGQYTCELCGYSYTEIIPKLYEIKLSNSTGTSYLQLTEFRDNFNNGDYGDCTGYTVKLLVDVDLNGSVWTPIGYHPYDTTETTVFAGTFDGNNKTISNLKIEGVGEGETNSTYESGFFGVCNGATIKDLSFANVDIEGNYESYGCGTLCGAVYDTTVTNIHILSGIVQEGWYSGGIIGMVCCGLTMSNCSNAATITNYYAGGIVAVMYDFNNTNSQTASTITNCTNTGNVSGNLAVGGIIGKAKGVTISNCTNNGDVSTADSRDREEPAGGILGCMDPYVKIIYCINNGDVSVSGTTNANAGAGGIVGNSGTYTGTEISYCINTGDVSNENVNASGIICNLYGVTPVNYCYNSGAITAKVSAGGIFAKPAYGSSGTCTNCVNAGAVSCTDATKQYVISQATMINCFYYDGATLKDSANTEVADVDAAITTLNTESTFWDKKEGIIIPISIK